MKPCIVHFAHCIEARMPPGTRDWISLDKPPTATIPLLEGLPLPASNPNAFYDRRTLSDNKGNVAVE